MREPVVLDHPPAERPALDTVSVDEADVAPYELPDPLRFESGDKVTTESWDQRRAEIVQLFEDHVYGRTPAGEMTMTTDEFESGPTLGGAATRRQIRLTTSTSNGSIPIDLLLISPADLDEPAGAFVVPNFDGNHTVAHDPAIEWSAGARRDRGDDIEPRGSKQRRFPTESIVGRGFALATFYAADTDSDADDGFLHGVHRLFYADGQTAPAPYEWGTIGAWAWGCSRVLDHLLTEESIDTARVIVGGHSRLGKTALWAAAQDQRFAAAFSNDSGCTGAALSRRRLGENVAVITELFPHWFCRNYRRYASDEDALPVDQHQLLALLAPRPVHVGSASDDQWADPRGEFLAACAAGAVYELLGQPALALTAMPDSGEGSVGAIGYHLRAGEHDLLESDWQRYLSLADQLR